MDQTVGKVTQLVKDLGLDDNTIVIFTRDNGPAEERLSGSDSAFFTEVKSKRSNGDSEGDTCSCHRNLNFRS